MNVTYKVKMQERNAAFFLMLTYVLNILQKLFSFQATDCNKRPTECYKPKGFYARVSVCVPHDSWQEVLTPCR